MPKIKVGQRSSAKNGHILRRRAMRSEYPREFWRKAWIFFCDFLLDQKKTRPNLEVYFQLQVDIYPLVI